MHLQEMYPTFVLLSSEEQDAFMIRYREKRLQDLSDITPKDAEKVNGLTAEEKAIMKALGISAKDLKMLKESL